MKYLLTLTAFVCAINLAGCQHNAYFEAALPSSPDNALVYLYRPQASNPGKKPLVLSYPDILVDGDSVGVLKYNEYLVLELAPGQREFVATGLTRQANWKPENVSYNMRLEAGQRYFMRLRVEYDTDHMTIGSFRGQYLIHMHAVDETEALYEIRYASESAAN